MNTQPESALPWYRQFWPWFIIALPASVVVAGLTTVYIAFNNADSLVDDNYFREGLAINVRLEQDQLAKQLQLRADLQWDVQTGELMVSLSSLSNDPKLLTQIAGQKQLQLLLTHPAREDEDQQLELFRVAPGYFRGSLDKPLAQRFYIRLVSPTQGWRLSGEMDFGNQTAITLGQ